MIKYYLYFKIFKSNIKLFIYDKKISLKHIYMFIIVLKFKNTYILEIF